MSCHCNEHSCHNHNEKDCCGHNEENKKFLVWRLIIGSLLFICAFITGLLPLYFAAYIILGYDVLINSVKDIRNIFNENFLMSIASAGAFAIGEYPEAVAVMLFYQIGECLSDYAVGKSKKSITALMDLRADTASVLRGDAFITAKCEDIKVGETILVSSGEKIPLDGIITKGSAYLDVSALTGEAKPVYVSAGDTVMSGSINTDSAVEIQVTKAFSESTASKILELVQTQKNSNSEKFITKFAKVYTPIVVLLAAVIALLPSLIIGNWHQWIYTALTFLVVSCPCALVVSVPLTFVAGIGSESKKGILIKGSYALENLAKIQCAAFDKTGTLTEGRFKVQSVRTKSGIKSEILTYAAYAEYYSGHPIAKAIRAAYNDNIDTSLIKDYKEIAGKGVSAVINGNRVLIGSQKFADSPDAEKNAVYVNINGEYAGYIVVEDKIKDNAKNALNQLKSIHIDTIMLTGDSESNAKDAASQLNINYYAELLPQDKITKLKDINKISAFIGDGINDAPVLSCADVGISMGGIGSDAAIEASDAVIMADDLEKIPTAVKTARKTIKIVKENIIIAIGIKVIIMILGLLHIVSMWAAVFADVGVCLLAVANAIRAYKD